MKREILWNITLFLFFSSKLFIAPNEKDTDNCPLTSATSTKDEDASIKMGMDQVC